MEDIIKNYTEINLTQIKLYILSIYIFIKFNMAYSLLIAFYLKN